MDQPLDAEVRDLLLARKGDWQKIADDTAAGVSYSWLSKFVNGHIGNPGYATLRRLRAYLKGEPLDTQPGALDDHDAAPVGA